MNLILTGTINYDTLKNGLLKRGLNAGKKTPQGFQLPCGDCNLESGFKLFYLIFSIIYFYKKFRSSYIFWCIMFTD